MSPPSAEEAGGAAIYAAFVAAQVERQEARKASFEERGIAVITTSGVLVSLLFGLAAVLTGAAGYHPPAGSRAPILASLVCFVGAALSGLLANAPLNYEGVTADALEKSVKERIGDTAATAAREVALTEIKTIRRAKLQNSRKGRAVIVAIAAEIAAVLFLAVAVAVILYH